MSYLIFRGVSTESIGGVAVSKMPAHKRAAMRYTEYYVKGRDGALHTDEGYANMELDATLILLDANPETRYSVNAWASGSGKLTTSDDPTRAFRASVRREVQWQRVPGNSGYFDTARINFDCEPYLYETNDSVIEFTANGELSNPGTATALPLIKVEGSGNVKFGINGKDITVKGMTSGVPVFLDSEIGYIYASSGNMEMVGEFPELPLGVCSVLLKTNATKITVTPHWRWI